MSRGACWKSSLELPLELPFLTSRQDDETESISSATGNYGDPKVTPVGPFIHNLFQNQLYTDVDFVFMDTKECLSAHRVVLAAKCKFFADLLFGDKKNSPTRTKRTIEIPNISFVVFKSIVNYLYTDDIDFPDLPTALDIHRTANNFKMESLIDLCEHYINDLELTEDNACSTLQIFNSKFADNLKNRCIEFIKIHTSEVISSPDFEKSSFNTVREIADLQDLSLQGESEMLKAVLRWINVQPEHTKVELRKSLLKCIRFTSFTAREFREAIKQHPKLLTSAEALDTLMYLNDPTRKNMKGLPNWINRSRRTCLSAKNNFGLEEIKLNNVGKLMIPLTTASERKNIACLTSILQLKCIKGKHKIKSFTINLEEISDDGKMSVEVFTKAFVVDETFNINFVKRINSKEAVIRFKKGIYVCSGQTLHLEVKINTCQSCKIFQYGSSKENILTNEYFQFSVASLPKKGRYYFLHEVLFQTLTQNVVPKKRHRNRRKKTKKAIQNHHGEDGTDDE